MNRKSLRSDARYTIDLEWCGEAKPQYVVRFCGEWQGKRATYGAALVFAACEASKRRGSPVIAGKRHS